MELLQPPPGTSLLFRIWGIRALGFDCSQLQSHAGRRIEPVLRFGAGIRGFPSKAQAVCVLHETGWQVTRYSASPRQPPQRSAVGRTVLSCACTSRNSRDGDALRYWPCVADVCDHCSSRWRLGAFRAFGPSVSCTSFKPLFAFICSPSLAGV